MTEAIPYNFERLPKLPRIMDEIGIFDRVKVNELPIRKPAEPFVFQEQIKSVTKVEKTETKPKPTKRKREEDYSSSDEEFISSPVSSFQESRNPNLVIQDNYVDITTLLTLPQKEAASHLGISESMLCKRFKESTRRKWPYRYIRKIDKVINMLCLHDGEASLEDKRKLERLLKEREERLQPVRIRITDHRLQTFSSPSPTNSKIDSSRSPSPSPVSSPYNSGSSTTEQQTEVPQQALVFEKLSDDEQFALETLEMLKSQRLPPKNNNTRL